MRIAAIPCRRLLHMSTDRRRAGRDARSRIAARSLKTSASLWFRILNRLAKRGVRLSPGLKQAMPNLEERLESFAPAFLVFLRNVVVYLISANNSVSFPYAGRQMLPGQVCMYTVALDLLCSNAQSGNVWDELANGVSAGGSPGKTEKAAPKDEKVVTTETTTLDTHTFRTTAPPTTSSTTSTTFSIPTGPPIPPGPPG